jgi:outer membrane biosynthesis protein TonB
MGLPELFLEHRNGEKVQKHLRVKPHGSVFLIGSSKEADLRLIGENVSGCHAALRYRAPHWYICDLSGTGETRVGNESIVERQIDESVVVEIGQHRLQLFSRQSDKVLFSETTDQGQVNLHQVVVRRKGRVLSTHLLKAGEFFNYQDGEVQHKLPPPSSEAWLTTEIGSRQIQQRLVSSQEIIAAQQLEVDRELVRPLLALLVLVFLFSLLFHFLPASDKSPMVVLDQKSQDIIFNAKVIKKKRSEVAKMSSQRIKKGGTSEAAPEQSTARSNPDESQAPKLTAKATAALTSLRASGLNQLIGKIAKRANKQGLMVAATGVSPDVAGSGRAFYSFGTTTTGGGGGASKEGTYRLGGIGTKGTGGGAANVKDGTALAGGSVGQGEVALVDDETVIEGGLDRDVIAEVIRRNLGQIRYCYERQLSSNRELYGKVMVKFQIAASGDVSEPKIDSTTMKSSMVEGCILRRLATWKFPLPKGGTIVKVSYPFLFKALD